MSTVPRAEPTVAITLDVDWAPDFMIDAAARVLSEAGVRATWFITHDSPAVQRLRRHTGLFELGWHPNFFPGSTHGATEDDVLAYCQVLEPEARVVRMHGLLQSSRLLTRLRGSTRVRTDVSQLLRGHAMLAVHALPLPSGTMMRVPFWWEDDVEMSADTPLWDLAGAFADGVPGLRVLNFHPVHIALDTKSLSAYEALKSQRATLVEVTADDVAAVRARYADQGASAAGTARAFHDAVEWLAMRDGGCTISQLVSNAMEKP